MYVSSETVREYRMTRARAEFCMTSTRRAPYLRRLLGGRCGRGSSLGGSIFSISKTASLAAASLSRAILFFMLLVPVSHPHEAAVSLMNKGLGLQM
jgi:hypothetical protein